MKRMLQCLLAVAAMFSGASTHAKEAPVKERGWIGGTYECAKSHRALGEYFFYRAEHTFYSFPSSLTSSQDTGMLVTSLGTNTPAYLAGLRPGDLILTTGGQPMRDWSGFWQIVNGSQPGSTLLVKAWRSGQTAEYRVIVGREKIQRSGSLTIGLPGFLDEFHPIPMREQPCFSLMLLGCEKKLDRAAEFASVKKQYEHACDPKEKQTSEETNWRLWLVIFELQKGHKILAQETVPASGAHM